MAHPGARIALPYVAALDGLRALAVLAVVAYHASVEGAPGGFFGVDVFFVISGYLVTVLFLERARVRRGILPLPDALDTCDFWKRRVRRLVPAAVVAVGITWLAFALLGARSAGALTAEAGAALAYLANWHFLVSEQSYFETISSPSPFLHFWSLAVEAQFYLLWPILLIGALRFGGRLAAFALAVSLAAISTLVVASLYSPDADPSRAYYGTDARVAGLLLGAALAIVVRPALAARAPRWPVEALGWGGLAALALLVTQMSEYDPFIYRGGFFLAATASVAVLVAALHEANGVARALGQAPLQWLGKRSYSIYLWHWPVFVLSQPQFSADLQSPSLLVARLAVTLVLADLSYRLVEDAFRRGWPRALTPAAARAWWEADLPLPRLHLGAGPYRDRPWARPAALVGVCLLAVVLAGGLPVRTGLADDLSGIQAQVAGVSERSGDGVRITVVAPASPTEAAAGALVAVEDTGAGVSRPASPLAAPGATATASGNAAPASRRDAEASGRPGGTATADTDADGTPASASSASASSGSALDGLSAATPEGTPASEPLGASVTVVGDSVVLGALNELAEALPGAVVDAEVGRQFRSAPEVLAGLAQDGALGDLVVVALGANGVFNDEHFDAVMEALDGRTAVFVTVTVPRRWEGEVNESLAAYAARHGALLADWHAVGAEQPDYFSADGVHLTDLGRAAYAELIADAVRSAIASR